MGCPRGQSRASNNTAPVATKRQGLSERDLENMAATLEQSGRYRVLRKIEPRTLISQPDGGPVRLGLFLDVETTGLDRDRDEIIELAMVPFTYAPDGRIFEVLPWFQSFNEPAKPISAEITAMTGITDAMVAGCRIDVAAVETHLAQVHLVIAHNAEFDRRFAERLSPAFSLKPWACSMRQIDWAGEGHEGLKLAHLAAGAGFFYDRHRAANDCLAAIELLASPLPRSGGSAFAQLLERARKPSYRIWAQGSPFELKDELKARGYRWNGDDAGAPRAWFIDVEHEKRDAEIAYLHTEIYQRDTDILIHAITALNRFSDRVAARAST